MLQSLTDEELDRYGAIAQDQLNREFDNWWAQVLAAVCASVAFCYAIWNLVVSESILTALFWVVVAIGLGTWPYQKVKMRGLWDKHCKAVAEEQARRSKTGAQGAN